MDVIQVLTDTAVLGKTSSLPGRASSAGGLVQAGSVLLQPEPTPFSSSSLDPPVGGDQGLSSVVFTSLPASQRQLAFITGGEDDVFHYFRKPISNYEISTACATCVLPLISCC